MEKTEQQSPYKILKMVNGDDFFCKVLKEYEDALVVEMPMSVMKHHVQQDEQHVIEHTGLHRWINYSNDPSFVIYKDRILSFGSLAPEVIFYYKMFCRKVRHEIKENINQDEDEMMEQIKTNLAKVAHFLEASEAIHTDEDVEEIEARLPSKRILH